MVNTAIVGKFYWPVITSDYTGPRLWLYNVTIGGGGTVGLVVDSTSFVKNTYIDAATAYSGTLATFTTCQHSTAQSITGSTGSTAYSTANFTNVTSGSEDFHLPSGSALIDAGTDLSGDAGMRSPRIGKVLPEVERGTSGLMSTFLRRPPYPCTPTRNNRE